MEAVDAARRGKVAGCPWFANDVEANYCFFRLMELDGDRQSDLARIASVCMTSDEEVKEIIKKFKSIADAELELNSIV
jgi:hypothetical protein